MCKDNPLRSIGLRIRERREAIGLSQESLAFTVGYKSRTSINKIELGKTDISQSMIMKLASALHTTPSYIMGWSDDSSVDAEEAAPGVESSFSPLDSQLMDLLRFLSDDQKKMLLAQIETLLQSQ